MTSVSSSVSEPSLKGEESPGVLPPCRVCGEKASGFHYGANTCEACKVRESECNISIYNSYQFLELNMLVL